MTVLGATGAIGATLLGGVSNIAALLALAVGIALTHLTREDQTP